jgi:hypothetical protein
MRISGGDFARAFCDVSGAISFHSCLDHDDFTRASNRTRSYFFFEWLAAIVLHQSTGFFALVTRYQTDARKRPLLPDILPPDVLAVLADRTRWGKTQGPDLLMYAPDYSDWFFWECKGSRDTVSDRQHGRFDDLVAAAKKPIRMLEFQVYRPPSPNQAMHRTAGRSAF